MIILPFDAHNHVHMGPTRPLVAMLRHGSSDINNSNSTSNSISSSVALGGMALMSTHPRDYPKVLDLCYHTLPQQINELYYSTTTTTSTTTTLQEDGSRTAPPPLSPPIFIPCLGVHPWFVNDLTEEDWQLVDHNHTTYYNDYYKDGRTREREENEEENKNIGTPSSLHHHQVPRWIQQLEEHLLIDPPNSPFTTGTFDSLPQGKTTPPAVAAETANPPPRLRPLPPPPPIAVGEIGLDKFQFHPTTKELRCPMDIQIQAFYYQFELATRLERPVSLHCVHAMGPMVQVIRDVQLSYQKLPPKLYFHAFGGKEATVDQLVALVDKANKNTNANKRKAQAKKDKQKRMQEEEKKEKNASSIEKEDVETLLVSASAYQSSSSLTSTSKSTALPSARRTTSTSATTTPTKLYFGFAPVINFRSPKTAKVIQKVGLDRLVLETDHEDATFVPEAMILGIALLSKVFNVPPEQVIAQTTANAMELYGIILPSSDSDSSSST
jgi:Tat protein secretion system quality control protein TatD with DNase activity